MTPRAVHRIFIRFAAHGLHVFGWWWWRHGRSDGISLRSGNAVLALWYARSALTVRSRGVGVFCCRGRRVAGFYTVVLRPVPVVRLGFALCEP